MTHAMLTKILTNLIIFIVIFGASFWYLFKLNIKEKGFKLLFVTYTCFWIAPMLLRAYSGTIQNIIDKNFVVITLAAYGIVGIFIRPLADLMNFGFKSRKAFLYFASLIQLIFYIPILVSPSTTSSIIQSIGVGVGASCIGSFQLLAKEQYNENKSYLTVSILSIPPLLANFLTAPLQSLLMVFSNKDTFNTDINILKYLWLIGLVFTFISLILIFFMKEDRNKFSLDTQKTINSKQDIFDLVLLCLIGSIITFIKFSNSGSIGTLHLQTLGKLSNSPVDGYEGYLSVVFSLFQLAGGVLVGTFFVKKLNNISIFAIGCSVWIAYMVSSMFINDPLGYFFIHSLNGFGYGILYNFVLGTILSKSFSKKWVTPMGIYQSILSIGIAVSGIFTQFLKINMKLDFIVSMKIINLILILITLIAMGLYAIYWYFSIYSKQNLSRFKSFSIKQ